MRAEDTISFSRCLLIKNINFKSSVCFLKAKKTIFKNDSNREMVQWSRTLAPFPAPTSHIRPYCRSSGSVLCRGPQACTRGTYMHNDKTLMHIKFFKNNGKRQCMCLRLCQMAFVFCLIIIIYSLLLCVCICMMCVCGHACRGTCVDARGHLCGVVSLLHLLWLLRITSLCGGCLYVLSCVAGILFFFCSGLKTCILNPCLEI